MREGTEIATVDMGEIENMDDAKAVGDALETAYPGYLWMVSSASGVIAVKNGMLSQFGQYGMILPKHYSASHLKAEAIRAGGELLERCGLPRGAWPGHLPDHMEGSDQRQWRWGKGVAEQKVMLPNGKRMLPSEVRKDIEGLH